MSDLTPCTNSVIAVLEQHPEGLDGVAISRLTGMDATGVGFLLVCLYLQGRVRREENVDLPATYCL